MLTSAAETAANRAQQRRSAIPVCGLLPPACLNAAAFTQVVPLPPFNYELFSELLFCFELFNLKAIHIPTIIANISPGKPTTNILS